MREGLFARQIVEFFAMRVEEGVAGLRVIMDPKLRIFGEP
jgi:hypothetical protein